MLSTQRRARRAIGPQRADPALSYKYYVEIKGLMVAEFTECGGLQGEREVLPHKEGGFNNLERQLPGRVKFGPITLKRGVTYNRVLWDWFYTGAFDGRVQRTDLTITLGTADGYKAQVWNVFRAFPKQYQGPALQAESGNAAIEQIQIVHEGLDLVTLGARDESMSRV